MEARVQVALHSEEAMEEMKRSLSEVSPRITTKTRKGRFGIGQIGPK